MTLAAALEDVSALEAAINVRVADGWPPPLFDSDDIERFRTLARAGDARWGLWYIHWQYFPRP